MDIEVLVEDDLRYCEPAAEMGTKVILLDRPWNQQANDHENITRVKNWYEIRKVLGDL